MSEVKRFGFGLDGPGFRQCSDGCYVLISDFDRVTAERDAALAELAEQRLFLSHEVLANDHLQQRLTAADERLDAGISFVTRMIKCAGGQPSIATSYLRDILDKLKPAEGGGDEPR